MRLALLSTCPRLMRSAGVWKTILYITISRFHFDRSTARCLLKFTWRYWPLPPRHIFLLLLPISIPCVSNASVSAGRSSPGKKIPERASRSMSTSHSIAYNASITFSLYTFRGPLSYHTPHKTAHAANSTGSEYDSISVQESYLVTFWEQGVIPLDQLDVPHSFW